MAFRTPHRPGSPELVPARFAALLEGVDTVSFDVFDTLVERPLERAADMFEWLAEPVARRVGIALEAFGPVRLAAEREAREALGPGLDPSLEAIAEHLARRLGCDPSLAGAIADEEIALDRRLLRPRPEGRAMFEHAKRLGKRLVATSDTPYSGAALRSFLEGVGYHGLHAIRASSEAGATKREGALFDRVVADAGGDPSRILHVGDHARYDGAHARAKGLHALVVPRRELEYLESAAFERVFGAHGERLDVSTRAWSTIVGRTIAGEVPDDGSSFGGDPRILGAAALGPVLLGLALFVLDAARRDGRTELFFLARDGKLILDAYRLVASVTDGAPAARYLRCSRRAASVATMRTREDVLQRIATLRALGTLDEVLGDRLGYDVASIPDEVLARHGLPRSGRLGESRRARLLALVAELLPAILANAGDEREAYVRYLGEAGLRASPDHAVVDIGYAGTLQAALDSLATGAGGLGGYYLLTYASAKKTLAARRLECRAYAGDFVDRADALPPVGRHVTLYECLFLGEENSLVRMRTTASGIVPVELPEDASEVARRAVIRRIQQGALEFVADAVDAFGHDLDRLEVPASKSTRALDDFFRDPSPKDVAILADLPFEDRFGSAGVRPIVDRANGPVLWPEGRTALRLGSRPSESFRHALAEVAWIERSVARIKPFAAPIVAPLVDALAPFVLEETKLDKFRREPRRYFADASSAAARALGRVYLHHRRPNGEERR